MRLMLDEHDSDWMRNPGIPPGDVDLDDLWESGEGTDAVARRAEVKAALIAQEAKREQLREAAAEELDRWENQLVDTLVRLMERMEEVVVARLEGVKARKGTRHWRPQPTTEVKALDPEYVVDKARWIEEAASDLWKVVSYVVLAVGRDVLEGLATSRDEGAGWLSSWVLETPVVRTAVEEQVRDLTGFVDRRVDELRSAILDLDRQGASIREIVEGVRASQAQREAWARAWARTQTTASVGRAGVEAARLTGVAEKEWLSSRDDRVRPTHRTADGQVQPVTETFRVGDSRLRFPGDPLGEPGEVMNCRCTLLFRRVRKASEDE